MSPRKRRHTVMTDDSLEIVWNLVEAALQRTQADVLEIFDW